jgi:UDP-2,3-diacylglucosamine pyrophosphatase LpxH
MENHLMHPSGSDDAYTARIAAGLDRAYAAADLVRLDLDGFDAVIFSDHHRGRQDGADDFRRCEAAYRAALGFYVERGSSLWLLGDVEELWENRPAQVLDAYRDVLELERSFGADRLWRVFGNHDLAWRRARNVKKHLRRYLPPGTRLREAVRMQVASGNEVLGELLLTHGHQGTIDSGNAFVVPFARFVVREFWGRLQRSQGFASTAPSNDSRLRARHDRAMFEWARRRAERTGERVVLVAGHTHHPVFPGDPPPDLEALAADRSRDLEAARAQDPPDPVAVARARAALELARARADRDDGYVPPAISPPCYFNSGCCSFGDGDVTALEIRDGRIRLVRWLDDDGDPQPEFLSDALSLAEVFAGFATAPAARPGD